MENQSIIMNQSMPYELSILDITIATIYISEASLLVILHTICCYLMYTDKEMQNPTYAFMINLGICDIVELSMTGIYAGIIILTRWHNDTVSRWASFLCLEFWYANCALMPLVAFSRWVAITMPHKTQIIFKRSILWSLQASAWLILGPICMYGCVLDPVGSMFQFYVDFYTWGFNTNTQIGRTFTWLNVVIDSLCTVFGMSFNALSLYHVHKTRKQVEHLGTKENRGREIKLLVQCVMLECVFVATYILFTAAHAVELNLAWFLSLQTVWTLNHSVNPLVYLTVNTRLRKRTLKILTCGKAGSDEEVKTITISVRQQSQAVQ